MDSVKGYEFMQYFQVHVKNSVDNNFEKGTENNTKNRMIKYHTLVSLVTSPGCPLQALAYHFLLNQ